MFCFQSLCKAQIYYPSKDNIQTQKGDQQQISEESMEIERKKGNGRPIKPGKKGMKIVEKDKVRKFKNIRMEEEVDDIEEKKFAHGGQDEENEESDVEVSASQFFEMADDDVEEMESRALAEVAKAAKKPSRKATLKQVMDFKFRVIELVEIFVKRLRNPSMFISSFVPLIHMLETKTTGGSGGNQQRSVLVNKVANLVKSYFSKILSDTTSYENNLGECLDILTELAPRVESQTIKAVVRFAYQTIVTIWIKIGTPEALANVVKHLAELLKKMISTRSTKVHKEYFLHLLKLSPSTIFKLVPNFIAAIAPKEGFEGGARTEEQRKACLDILTTILQGKQGKNVTKEDTENEDLALLLQECTSELGNIFLGVLKSHASIKAQKYAVLVQYTQVFQNSLDILKTTSGFEKAHKTLSKFLPKIQLSLEELAAEEEAANTPADKQIFGKLKKKFVKA